MLNVEAASVGYQNSLLQNGGGFNLIEPVQRDFIRRNQPSLRTQLSTHVAQGHALLHGQGAHGSTREFNRLVVRAIHAKAGDHVQHHVFGANTASQLARPIHRNGLRHAQPDATRHHHAQHLGAADAKHVGPKRAACGRMRVTPHAKHAGLNVPVLRHHHVADAQAVIHMRQCLLACPVAGDTHDLARSLVALGHVVIHHQHDFGFIPNLRTQFLQHRLQAARARGVVKHRQINLAGDDLGHRQRIASSGAGNELLCQ